MFVGLSDRLLEGLERLHRNKHRAENILKYQAQFMLFSSTNILKRAIITIR